MQYVSASPEAVRAFLEAEDIAVNADHPLSSAHLLLALFTFPNRAQVLLNERHLSEEDILDAIRVFEDEPRRTVDKLRTRSREIAVGANAEAVDCLHVLIAVTRFRDCFAYKLLERTGTSITAIRNTAVSYITGRLPRRYRSIPTPNLSRTIITQRRPSRPQTTAQPTTQLAPPLEAAPLPEQQDEFTAIEPAVDAAASAPNHAAITEGKTLEELAPTLMSLGVDLTSEARKQCLDMVIGREQELEAVVDILGKRRANNPILVGPPGVGKTAIVEGLAVMIARGDEDVAHFSDKIIFSLNTGALVAGTSLRGAFSERLAAVKKEVLEANGKIIVFIDEIHTLMGTGTSGDSPQDAANELKTALARGEFPCIGATTIDEFKKHIEKDPALERRFAPVEVNEPSQDEAILILEGGVTAYAEHHGITFCVDAIHAAVHLTHRFIPERKLPDKAFAVMDLAGSRARRRGSDKVERIDIARVVHQMSGVPLDRLAEIDADRFTRAESIMSEQLIGHADVVTSICTSIRRGFAGFNGHRPIGSFLFLGPTGVGKTELVKVMADFLFGRRDAVVRVDMSEFAEQHSVARLIGAQPGYVGYDEGGQLTEALRKKPFQIVLFDEIEKGHKDVLNLLLQILDEGQLTDSKGRKISFANTLVVLTSNIGAAAFNTSTERAIGFGGSNQTAQDSSKAEHKVLEIAQKILPPELWGRLDERLVFEPLSREQVRQIASLQLSQSATSLFAEREITLNWTDKVLDVLLDNGGYSPEQGARGMRHAIQRHIEGPISEMILQGELSFCDFVRVGTKRNGELAIKKIAQKSAARSTA